MKGFAYLLGIGLLLSCSRGDEPQISLQGTYVGSFQRDNDSPSSVELTFTQNQYSGKALTNSGNAADAVRPVICSGNFVVTNQTIDFQDNCVYPANFDWSLILAHQWTLVRNDDQLILSRNHDRYVLTKH